VETEGFGKVRSAIRNNKAELTTDTIIKYLLRIAFLAIAGLALWNLLLKTTT